jgi:hypothetical protein
MAGLLAILFLATRIAEAAIFVFRSSALGYSQIIPSYVSQDVSGAWVQDIPNYYVGVTGS